MPLTPQGEADVVDWRRLEEHRGGVLTQQGKFVLGTDPPRWVTGGSALLLSGVATLYLKVLVADWGDNAYLWLAFIGYALFPIIVVFAVATLLPHDAFRRIVVALGVAFTFAFGVISVLALVQALIVIPSQNYRTNQVFISHLAGLVTLLPALVAILICNLVGRRVVN